MSLFEELTTLPVPPYPVTGLLRELLGIVALDACRTKRNVHSTYLVVSHARDVCEKIHTLAATAGDTDSLDDFKAYTRMITSLEGILLGFEPLSWTESNAETLPTAETVKKDLKFIDAWKDNRMALRRIVMQLQENFKDDSPSEAEIKATYKHDDGALLITLSESLADVTETLSGIAKDNVCKIRKQLDAIQAAFVVTPDNVPDDVVVYAIQTAMAIEIVASARDSQMSPRRELPEMWTKATSLVDRVLNHSKNASLPLNPLRQAWDEFRVYLLTGTTPSKFAPNVAEGEPGAKPGTPASTALTAPTNSKSGQRGSSETLPLAKSGLTAPSDQPDAPASAQLGTPAGSKLGAPPTSRSSTPASSQPKAATSSHPSATANSKRSAPASSESSASRTATQPNAPAGSGSSVPGSSASGTPASSKFGSSSCYPGAADAASDSTEGSVRYLGA
ncbi:hypothetical protein B0H19DRAFT_1268345 [Mycena capillaripes]|nr:hypothetical protein B0H19DRAFT_1268345 [Mycena capillaripes]